MTDPIPQNLTLTNHKTSEKKEFTLRLFRHGDEEAVINCIREEYGDTYYRRDFYDKEKLLELADSDKLYLFLAVCGDDLCGIQSIISHQPKESRLEGASQIFKKAYRGYGLPYELVKYTYKIAKSLEPGCIYASTVVFHNITQSMCQRAGMVPVAFNFGSHLTNKMHNSYALGHSEKYAQAILILPVAKQDAGNIYIPPAISGVVKKIYTNLGVKYNIINSKGSKYDIPDGLKTVFDIKVNDREQSVSISTDAIGADFHERIAGIKKKYSEKFWTISLTLPVDGKAGCYAYEVLIKEGFFFTGIKPLCSEHECIYMQYIGDVRFCFDEYVLTEGFKELLNDILSLKGDLNDK